MAHYRGEGNPSCVLSDFSCGHPGCTAGSDVVRHHSSRSVKGEWNVLRRTLIVLLAVVASGCSASSGSDASTSNASDGSGGGWAPSEAAFTARWNQRVKDPYKLSAFQGDSNDKNGAKATYLAGEITFYRGIYMNRITDPHWFGAMCTFMIHAATGIPVDVAEGLARQTYANLEASPLQHGLLHYQGYSITMDQIPVSQTQLNQSCDVAPTDVMTAGGRSN